MLTDGRIDRHEEANSRLLKFYESPINIFDEKRPPPPPKKKAHLKLLFFFSFSSRFYISAHGTIIKASTVQIIFNSNLSFHEPNFCRYSFDGNHYTLLFRYTK